MNLALFDFDGTITTRELMPDFVRMATTKRRLVVGQVVLAPVIVGYKVGLVGGNRVRERIADVAFRGLQQDDVHAAGKRFAHETIPAALRPDAMARVQWHRDQGDTIVVVSGSFDLYLSYWCAQHGLDLLCSSLEAREGVMTGRFAGAQCVGSEKARRVRARYELSRYPVVYAYVDTHEDRELLALAHRRWYRGREIA